MKLSEAIILGSTMYKQAFGQAVNKDGSRCAIGGALGAIGIQVEKTGYLGSVYTTWSWSQQNISCPITNCVRRWSVGEMIVHLNDIHRWPTAKIGAWVRSIEPQDFIQDLTQSIKQNADKFTECEYCEALSEKAKGYWTEGHFYCELCSPAIREQEIRIGNEHSDYQNDLVRR